MDIIKMARELGKAIQEDQLYKDMVTANDLAENSAELQKKLEEFSELRTQINREIMKAEDEKSNEKITELDSKLRKLYDEIASSPEMIAYNAAKSALHKIGQIVLEGHLKHCVRYGIEHGDAEKTLSDFSKALEHFSRMS